MSAETKIEWTDKSWNPVRGCSVVSPGCSACYAMKQAHRFSGEGKPYFGLTEIGPKGPRWTGKIHLAEDQLDQPLRWRKPQRIFVNSMSDLFHEDIPDAFIDRVFAVMAMAPQHTFQVLTKRAERMRNYLAANSRHDAIVAAMDMPSWLPAGRRFLRVPENWPLPNAWLGVSVENQHFADERIPLLLQTPAAVRFISAEPLLGPVNLERYVKKTRTLHVCADVEGMLANKSFDGLSDNGKPLSRSEAESGMRTLVARGVKRIQMSDECVGFSDQTGCPGHQHPRLDWVIVGGESGPQSRPFDLAWARSIVKQCQTAGVPVFYKQGGTSNRCRHNSKGGCFDCIPTDLQVREFPAAQTIGGAA